MRVREPSGRGWARGRRVVTPTELQAEAALRMRGVAGGSGSPGAVGVGRAPAGASRASTALGPPSRAFGEAASSASSPFPTRRPDELG